MPMGVGLRDFLPVNRRMIFQEDSRILIFSAQCFLGKKEIRPASTALEFSVLDPVCGTIFAAWRGGTSWGNSASNCCGIQGCRDRLSRISLRLNELHLSFLEKAQGHRRCDQEKQKTDPPVARVVALTDRFDRCGWQSFKKSQSDF